MRLLLIRHGETEHNVGRLLDTAYPGAALTPTGHEQAQALVATLADEPIEAIYTSDLTRARQTAEPLAAARHLPPTALPQLREIQAGDHELSADWMPYVEAILRWRTDPWYAIPGGDSGVGFYRRFDEGIALAARYDCAAVVAHGAALRAWVHARCPNVTDADLAAAPMVNGTVIVVEGGPAAGWRALRWGDLTIEPVRS